jgi:hypothetical protein
VLAVRLIDYHGLGVDVLTRHAEQDGAQSQQRVDCHGCPVERAAVEAQIAGHVENVPVSVAERYHAEDAEGLVDVVRILPRYKLSHLSIFVQKVPEDEARDGLGHIVRVVIAGLLPAGAAGGERIGRLGGLHGWINVHLFCLLLLLVLLPLV